MLRPIHVRVAVRPLLTGTAAVAVLALTLSGCAAAAAADAATTPASATKLSAPSPAATIPGCRLGVWAEDFTDAGKLAWQRSLPVPGAASGWPVQPLAIGGVTVFTDGNSLYALRATDGHPLWHKVFPNGSNTLTAGITGNVGGSWGWQGSVIAVLGEDSAAPSLVSLNATTGKVRWQVKFHAGSYPPAFAVFPSAGVAVLITADDSVQTFDLATGKALWSRAYRKDIDIQAVGPILVIDSKPTDESPSTLHGVVGRTGHTLWARSDFPNEFSFAPAPGGRIVGYGTALLAVPGKQPVYPVLAVSAATGKTLWQVRPASPVIAASPSSAGVFITADNLVDPATRLYLADLSTGAVRWSATEKSSSSEPQPAPVVTATDVTSFVSTIDTDTVIDRSTATGAVRWTAAIAPGNNYQYLAKPSGPDILVSFPGATASKPSRLLSINTATGKNAATDSLPATSTVQTPPTVLGGNALLEPMTESCAVPVHPGLP